MSFYKLQPWEDSLIGDLGFSFTADAVRSVANSLYIFKNKYQLDVICVGYDKRTLSEEFSHELSNCLSHSGVAVKMIDGPSPIFLLSWLATQIDKDKKCIGVYIGGDAAPFGKLSISFRNSDGSPFQYPQTLEIYNEYLFGLRNPSINSDRPRGIEYIDVRDGYSQWLVDTLKKEPYEKPVPIGLDFLTSPANNYMFSLLEKLNMVSSTVPETFYDRLVVSRKLRPFPSGWALTYGFSKFKKEKINFAFDGDADCIGLLDGATNEEISPSGMCILLLYYLAKVKRKRGTVLLSKSLNEKVFKIAEHYDLSVEKVTGALSGLSEKLKEKRSRPALMYADEFGGFWFKGFPLDRNPFPAILFIVDACLHSNLSPGKLYDKIVKDIIKEPTSAAKMDMYPQQINKVRLLELVENKKPGFIVERSKIVSLDPGQIVDVESDLIFFTTHSFTLDNESKVILQANPKNGFIELYVEGKNKEHVHETIGQVQSYLGG